MFVICFGKLLSVLKNGVDYCHEKSAVYPVQYIMCAC